MKPSTKALWRQAKIATRSGVNNIIVPFIRPIPQGDDIKFGANKISDLIPKLDGALQLLISPRDQMAGTFRNVERLGNEIVKNGDFHNFTFDYPSIGEASPFYESDFSSGTDDWGAKYGTIIGNIDGIDGEDDCLKFYADNSSGLHYIRRYLLNNANSQHFKVTAKVYIPSANTTLKQVIVSDGSTVDGSQTVTSLDSWTNINFEIASDMNHNYLIFMGADNTGNTSFTGAGVDTDDIFYVKDIKVQRVGLVAHWVFDDYYHAQEGTGKTTLQDLTANGHDLTASSGFDYSNQMTGDNPAYKNGNALQFDGIDDYFYIPAASADAFNPGSNSFSIAFRLNGDNVSGGYIINKIGTARYSVRWTFIDPYVYIQVYLYDDAGNMVVNPDYVAKFVFDGSYHNVVVVFDWDSKLIYGYLDGVFYRSVDFSSIAAPVNPTGDLLLGAYSSSAAFYSGYLSESAYFNRALSATEVKALYAKAYGWDWDEVGDLDKDSNFHQIISGGGTLTQDVTTLDNTLYKEQLVGEGINNVDYFGETTSHTVTLTDGTWTSASVKEVTNVDEIPNFVEDFSKGGAKYEEITVAGTQSTQLYANATKTSYYLGDGTSAEVVGDFRVLNGNHGIAKGGLETGQPVHPYSWEFNGVDDYVDMGDILDIHTNSAIFNLWVKYTFSVIYAPILIKVGVAGHSDYAGLRILEGTNENNIFLALADEDFANTVTSTVTATGIGDGNFHLLSVVIDRDNDIAKVYVDAVLTGSLDISAVHGIDIYATNNLIIGYNSLNSKYFEGKLGIIPPYLFDGQNGRPSSLPSNYEQVMKLIYERTKFIKYLER